MNLQERLHQNLCQTTRLAQSWFEAQRKDKYLPIYSSFDIRDSGEKIVCVDANIFPGGFNNVCRVDREECPPKFKSYIETTYGSQIKKIALLAEEHTANLYYWDNVYSIREMLTQAGYEVVICWPRQLQVPFKITSASGFEIEVQSGQPEGTGLKVGDQFFADLIVCNNDFSVAHHEWTKNLQTPMTPPSSLGWYQRQKSRYFKHYNLLATEFAQLIGIDPWFLTVETDFVDHFDMDLVDHRESLAVRVEQMLTRVRGEYSKRKIQSPAAVFVKSNSGTYGMAVASVQSGDEIRGWNSKSRKRMSVSKGGREVEELIIQEGIPTSVHSDGATAEPVIYMIGCQLAGGFLRAHGQKSSVENLNSPGAVFKSLCMTELIVRCDKCPMENVYGWVAKLALLAIEAESREMGVTYRGARDPFEQTRAFLK